MIHMEIENKLKNLLMLFHECSPTCRTLEYLFSMELLMIVPLINAGDVLLAILTLHIFKRMILHMSLQTRIVQVAFVANLTHELEGFKNLSL